MLKILQPFLLLCFLFSSIYAQNGGTITGSVKSINKKPLSIVNVALQGTALGTFTDESGNYTINNIPSGTYTVVYSYVGYRTETRNITVSSNSSVNVPDVIILESPEELEQVVIRSEKYGKYIILDSEYAAKIPVKNMEYPQSYSSLDNRIMFEQNLTDLNSAFQSIPGGTVSAQNAIGTLAAYVRGFLTPAYMRNGLFTLNPLGGDPQTIERIEMIKGPSGALFGGTGISYGGLINKVTKKPIYKDYLQTGVTFGSYNLQRYTIDYNSPLNADETILFRVNAAHHTEGTFQDFGYEKSFVLAPSLYFKISKNLDLLVEAEMNSLDLSSRMYFLGAPALNISSIEQLKTDYNKSYLSGQLTHEPSQLNSYFGRLNYIFSKTWKLSAAFTLGSYSLNGSALLPLFLNDNLMIRDVFDYNGQYNTMVIQPNLSGEFLLFGMKNRVVFGLDYQYAEADNHSYRGRADTINYTAAALPIIDVERVRSNYFSLAWTQEQRNIYAAYVSDVISLTDRLNLLLSLRFDSFNHKGFINRITNQNTSPGYTQNSFTPQAGFTYQIIKDRIAVFANYFQGFRNVAPSLQGQTFKPEFARQYEAGVKMNTPEDLISSTISWYNIHVSDKLRTDPANPLLSIQDGVQLSRGADVDLRLNLSTQLSIITGYSYNESRFEKAAPAVEGKRPLGTPKHVLNFWSKYSPSGILNGFSLGAGFSYTDDYFFNDINTLTIPSVFIFKGIISYSFNSLRISFTGENLGNKRYWDYTGYPQAPRRFLVSLSYNI